MRINRLFTLSLVALMTLFMVGSSVAQDSELTTVEETIHQDIMEWDEAFSAGDLDGLLAFYADDMVAIPPGLPVREGKEAFRAMFEPVFEANDVTHETRVMDIRVTDDMVVELSEFTMTLDPLEGGDEVVQHGRRVLVRELMDDEWKIIWAMWNTFQPEPEE